jgi:hypothetical protein
MRDDICCNESQEAVITADYVHSWDIDWVRRELVGNAGFDGMR